MLTIKKIIRNSFRKLGYDVSKITPAPAGEDAFSVQKSLLKGVEKPIIFDVGAFVGETALLYTSLFEQCEIHSFEPTGESFRKLTEAIKDYAHIKAYNLALGNRNGKVAFHLNSHAPTNSILSSDKKGASTWGAGLLDTTATEQVDLITLDDFVAEKSIDRIDRQN